MNRNEEYEIVGKCKSGVVFMKKGSAAYQVIDASQPSLYFDREGNAISMTVWSYLLETQYKNIEISDLPNGYRVATIWTGEGYVAPDPKKPNRTYIFMTSVYNQLGK